MLFHSLSDGKCQIVKGRRFSKSRYVNSYITYLRSLIMREVSYMVVRVYDHVHGVQRRMISVVNFLYF